MLKKAWNGGSGGHDLLGRQSWKVVEGAVGNGCPKKLPAGMPHAARAFSDQNVFSFLELLNNQATQEGLTYFGRTAEQTSD